MQKIAYICDRKKCENCHDYCYHTTDIEHAVNFQNMSDDVWFEKEEKYDILDVLNSLRE